MNIVLIVLESLRKDCVNAYGQPPWGKVHTPHLDAFARESVMFTRAYPESLPTLPARRALYTGRRSYSFSKGDDRQAGDSLDIPGWGAIPADQDTLAEMLKAAGYRTGLIADVYPMFEPSSNHWRGFDQWSFVRGQQCDPYRSGPRLSQEQLDNWLPEEMRGHPFPMEIIERSIMNMHDRTKEEDYCASRVMREAACWLEQNADAEKFFLTVESFDIHEPWLVPEHYRRMYSDRDGREQVASSYADTTKLPPELLDRTRANYCGAVTMSDRWFGHLMEQMRVMRLLDTTLVIVTGDHGHSIGDDQFMGKRGYPSKPVVFDVPLMIRLPKGRHAGKKADLFVQHHDITAEILRAARVRPSSAIDGMPFLNNAVAGRAGRRDHVTVGWGSAATVINKRWWFNAKVDGKGVVLHEMKGGRPLAKNVAHKHPHVTRKLFDIALADVGGVFPQWLVELAPDDPDVPGSTELAARK